MNGLCVYKFMLLPSSLAKSRRQYMFQRNKLRAVCAVGGGIYVWKKEKMSKRGLEMDGCYPMTQHEGHRDMEKCRRMVDPENSALMLM
jgi:hypothetical protein